MALSSEEELALAQMMAGEAEGEPLLGKRAVLHVALNRVGHPLIRHRHGILDVMKEFDGYRRETSALAQAEALDILRAEMREDREDPTNGAIFFENPDVATSGWFIRNIRNSDKYTSVRIGNHVFYAPK